MFGRSQIMVDNNLIKPFQLDIMYHDRFWRVLCMIQYLGNDPFSFTYCTYQFSFRVSEYYRQVLISATKLSYVGYCTLYI